MSVCRWLRELFRVAVGQLICQLRLEASFSPDCWLRWQPNTQTHTHSWSPTRSHAHTCRLTRLAEPRGATVKEPQTRRVTHAGELPSPNTCTLLQRCSGLQWPSRGSLCLTDPHRGRRHLQTLLGKDTHTNTHTVWAKGSFASVARLVWGLMESRNAWILLKIYKYDLWLTVPINW